MRTPAFGFKTVIIPYIIMKRLANNSAFTLVEILIVTAIIAIMASIAIPNILRARLNARVSRVASNLKTFATGFQMYAVDHGALPPDSHLVLPPGMDVYIDPEDWAKDAMGGQFNWEGPTWGEGGPYDYAGISLFGTTATVEELTILDIAFDDGDLTSGFFKQTPNGRYTFILEE